MSAHHTRMIEWIASGGLIALGTMIGGGVRWLWVRIAESRETRDAKVSEREEGYVRKLEARLEAVEEQVRSQGQELERHKLALALLVGEVTRNNPGAAVLAQVGKILGDAFPLHVFMTPDMTETLGSIK